MFSYNPRTSGMDAVTSARAAYFAQRGLLYTYRDGKMVNSYHLHIKERRAPHSASGSRMDIGMLGRG